LEAEPLADLIAHIRNTHHQYTRAAVARLGPLFDKVCPVHGKNHPELARMRATFGGLAQELATHLMKEEMVLFPYVVRMEEAVVEKSPPDACASYRTLYQALAEFETDLHQHIHLETNILFPRAIEMEQGIEGRP